MLSSTVSSKRRSPTPPPPSQHASALLDEANPNTPKRGIHEIYKKMIERDLFNRGARSFPPKEINKSGVTFHAFSKLNKNYKPLDISEEIGTVFFITRDEAGKVVAIDNLFTSGAMGAEGNFEPFRFGGPCTELGVFGALKIKVLQNEMQLLLAGDYTALKHQLGELVKGSKTEGDKSKYGDYLSNLDKGEDLTLRRLIGAMILCEDIPKNFLKVEEAVLGRFKKIEEKIAAGEEKKSASLEFDPLYQLCKERENRLKSLLSTLKSDITTIAYTWVSQYSKVLDAVLNTVSKADPALTKLGVGRALNYRYINRTFDGLVATAIAATRLHGYLENRTLGRSFIQNTLGGKSEECSRVDDLYAYKNDPKRGGGPLCCFKPTKAEVMEALLKRRELEESEAFKSNLDDQLDGYLSSFEHMVWLSKTLEELKGKATEPWKLVDHMECTLSTRKPSAKRSRDSDDGDLAMSERETEKGIILEIMALDMKNAGAKVPLTEAELASDEAQMKEREDLWRALSEGEGKKLGAANKMVKATMIKCAEEKYGQAGNFTADGSGVFDDSAAVEELKKVGWADWFNKYYNEKASEYSPTDSRMVFDAPKPSNSLLEYIQKSDLEELCNVLEYKSRILRPFRAAT